MMFGKKLQRVKCNCPRNNKYSDDWSKFFWVRWQQLVDGCGAECIATNNSTELPNFHNCQNGTRLIKGNSKMNHPQLKELD